jgi:E3 ubiquitin-protein ligase DOA10
MTTVMHKFLIYLSIYLCLTYFGLSFSQYSEAGVQFLQWFKSTGTGADTIPRRLRLHFSFTFVFAKF